jgi:mRNA-degrading endonuclease RelE of RelBE toxin-antitoxin system
MPGPRFQSVVWSPDWDRSYRRLSEARQKACDRAVLALFEGNWSQGMRVKPIRPEKYYLEARISSGDRIVFRFEDRTIFLMDVVEHDDIGRYGRRPRTPL